MMLAGHAPSMGGWLSLTVTIKLHEAELPLASVAVQVTVVLPVEKFDPEGGLQLTVTAPGQLSLAVGVVYVTTAEQSPAAAFALRLAGQTIVGGCVSTVNVPVAVVLLLLLVTVNEVAPDGVAAVVVIVSVLVFVLSAEANETGFGEKEKVAPVGSAVEMPNVAVNAPPPLPWRFNVIR
jgi:hypothetical protein